MAYSEFTVSKIKQEFGIHLDEKGNHFAKLEPIKISQHLREQLDEGVPLASMINTEKARSEQIISPVLLEARRQAGCSVSIFSGVEFNVDENKGLKGNCDFLLSLSEEQLIRRKPDRRGRGIKERQRGVGIRSMSRRNGGHQGIQQTAR